MSGLDSDQPIFDGMHTPSAKGVGSSEWPGLYHMPNPLVELGSVLLQPQGMVSPWDFITRRSEKEHLKAEKSGTNVAFLFVKPSSHTHIQGSFFLFKTILAIFIYISPMWTSELTVKFSKMCHWVFGIVLDLCIHLEDLTSLQY